MMDHLVAKFGLKKSKGDIIFCEYEPGNSLFFIRDGHVRVSKIIADKEKTLAVIGPGDIFGEMAILESAPRSATAVADDDVSLLEFDTNSFAQLVNSQPSIAVKLLRIFAMRIHDQKRKFKIINLPDSDSKIMDVFLMLAQNKGIDVEHVQKMQFEIKIPEVANWAGITLEDCQATLAQMEANNRISVHGEIIEVENLYQFSRHVASKRQSMESDNV